ncbi:hypothetical protein Prudu_010246, partial [Prunus dulcis]
TYIMRGAILPDHHHRLNGMDDLPDVVLMEILCRLPCYKFVSHCKCVSKRWCSLISDPYFISRCASLQREYHHQETPIILINKKRELLNRISNPLKPFFRRFKEFHGGLIQEEPMVAVSNRKFKVQIFSSETGQWRETIVSSPRDIRLSRVQFHICFANAYNRMLYWICSSFFLLELDPFIITNPTSTSDGDYECRLIDLEDDDWDSNRILSCLGVHGGRLKMFDYVSAVNTFFVWDLNVNKEEYHGGFEKVCLDNVTYYILEKDMVPKREDAMDTECIALDPNNEEIIYLVIDDEIVMFNIRTRIQSKLDGRITIDNGLNCQFFQVVVPWWPTPVPRLPQNAHAQSATKNQSQWEEEMGKVMESAPSAQLQSSSESCGEAAGPDE